jgi:TDG/mug DNA glycosylase family protein
MLPDILAHNLKTIFCGTAAGKASARAGHYYAGRGNQFWSTLHRVGLTPRELHPVEDQSLLEFGIGLTDLAKGISGMDRDIPASAYQPERLRQIVTIWKPRAIAFNGKKAAESALPLNASTSFGCLHPPLIAETKVWILPSTSGAARRYWDVRIWQDFARSLNN